MGSGFAALAPQHYGYLLERLMRRVLEGEPSVLADQNSVVDSIPVEAGYPDLWEISFVTVDTAYVPNSIKSASALRGAKLSIGLPRAVRNLPIVIIDGSPFRRTPSPLRTFADFRSPFPPKLTPPQ